ncbi:MAG: hypothetical protein HOL22_07080 [Euryarchaeota archaeon]|nr:hypothetical protein [Euryarchaeota archaeon]MBT5844014.1 hypothetical protein [Euryarchaeota archaeon]
MASVLTISSDVMRRFKLIRPKEGMEASVWGSVSVAVNSTKMGLDSADFAAINSRVTNCSPDFVKKPNKSITFDFKPKHLLSSNSNNNSNIHKTNTINSRAGDWYAAEALGN